MVEEFSLEIRALEQGLRFKLIEPLDQVGSVLPDKRLEKALAFAIVEEKFPRRRPPQKNKMKQRRGRNPGFDFHAETDQLGEFGL